MLGSSAERHASSPSGRTHDAGPRLMGTTDHSRLRLGVPIAVVVEDLREPLDEGAKKTSFNLIRALLDAGADISVFTRYQPCALEGASSLPANGLLLGPRFRRELSSLGPAFVLYLPSAAGTLGAFVRARVLKAFSDAPVALLSLQHRELPPFARYFGLKRAANVVFTASEASARVFRSMGCNTVALPPSVDLAVFRPVDTERKSWLRSRYGFGIDETIVLHVGHLKAERNVLALTRLAEAGLRTVLVASAYSGADPDVLARLERAGVMVVSDFVHHIEHYYQLSDCYCFPVHHAEEAIDAPLSVFEAMACNLPVVTTPFGGLPDWFSDGAGLRFVKRDQDLPAAVREVMAEPEPDTAQMVASFSWDRCASAILEAADGLDRRPNGAGLLICLVGIDGSGKTTQAEMLLEWLRSEGFDAEYVWSRGEMLGARRLLLSLGRRALGTSTADIARSRATRRTYQTKKARLKRQPVIRALWSGLTRIEHLLQIRRDISRSLAGGHVVVCDRYLWDSLVDLAIMHSKGPEWLWCRRNRLARALVPVPDRTVLIDLSAEEAARRKDDIESVEELERHAELYRLLADREGFAVVDGRADIASIQEMIRDAVRGLLDRTG